MTSYKSSLIRRLKFKSKEVSLELKQVKEIYTKAVSGFCDSVSTYCYSKKIKNPLEDLGEKKEEFSEINSEFKSLFRKIAIATHPDKVSSEKDRSKLEEAVEAKGKNKATELIKIASDLKIKTDDLSFNSIEELEIDILKSEEEIHNIHNSFPWVWYYTPSNKKILVVESFINK